MHCSFLLLMIWVWAASLSNVHMQENNRSIVCKGNTSSNNMHIFWNISTNGKPTQLSTCYDGETSCLDYEPFRYRATISRDGASFTSQLYVYDIRTLTAESNLLCLVEDITSQLKEVVAKWNVCDIIFQSRFRPTFMNHSNSKKWNVYRAEEGEDIGVVCSVQGFESKAITLHVKCKTAESMIFWDRALNETSQVVTVNSSHVFDGSTCVCTASIMAIKCTNHTSLRFNIKPVGYVRPPPQGRIMKTSHVIAFIVTGFVLVSLVFILAAIGLSTLKVSTSTEDDQNNVQSSGESSSQEDAHHYEDIDLSSPLRASSNVEISSQDTFISNLSIYMPVDASSYEDQSDSISLDNYVRPGSYSSYIVPPRSTSKGRTSKGAFGKLTAITFGALTWFYGDSQESITKHTHLKNSYRVSQTSVLTRSSSDRRRSYKSKSLQYERRVSYRIIRGINNCSLLDAQHFPSSTDVSNSSITVCDWSAYSESLQSVHKMSEKEEERGIGECCYDVGIHRNLTL